MIVCYGVFVAYPSTGAVYAVTLIGNALHAGWFPVMWFVVSSFTGSEFSCIADKVEIGHGACKLLHEPRDLRFLSDS
jgi:hypothetical protein